MNARMLAAMMLGTVACGHVENMVRQTSEMFPSPDRPLPPECKDVSIILDSEIFLVEVPQKKTLVERITLARLTWGNEGLSLRDLVLVPTATAARGSVFLEFVSFSGVVDSFQVFRLIYRHGYRHATAEEVLAFLAAHPEYPKADQPIVAFGTRWGGGKELIQVLYTYRKKRVDRTFAYRKWTVHIGKEKIEKVGPMLQEEIPREERMIRLGSAECGWPAGWRFAVVRDW